MSYRERRERRAERLRGWAGKREQKSAAAFDSARRIADGIPLGQPILVGHHSEKRHRRDIERIDNGMRRGVEHERKAASMASRADTIEHQLEVSIYSDDPDAVERLTERIAGLEAKRERIKTVNKLIRKVGLQAALPDLTDDEKRELLDLMRLCPYHKVEERGFPSYALTNLGGNISRQRERLTQITAKAEARARVREVLDAERAAGPDICERHSVAGPCADCARGVL